MESVTRVGKDFGTKIRGWAAVGEGGMRSGFMGGRRGGGGGRGGEGRSRGG